MHKNLFPIASYAVSDPNIPHCQHQIEAFAIEDDVGVKHYLVLETVREELNVHLTLHFFRSYMQAHQAFHQELERLAGENRYRASLGSLADRLERSRGSSRFKSYVGYLTSLQIPKGSRPWFRAKLGDRIDRFIAFPVMSANERLRLTKELRDEARAKIAQERSLKHPTSP